MVKFFSSKDEGKTWSLQTIVTNGHMDEIVGIYAISAIGGFVSACRDGTLKIWSLSKSSNKSGDSFWMISKSATWRNRRVTSLSISRAGLVIVGFEQFITIWNPTNLLELTGGLLFAQDDILAAGLIEESTELISLTRSGIANLWDLKGLVKIGTANVDLTSSGAVIHTAIVENRLLIVPPAGESCGSMISVCRSSAPLIVESIIVGDAGAKISGLCPIGSSVLISTRRGKELFKLSSEVGGVFRTPEEEEMVIEENLDTTIDDSPQYPLSKSTKSRLVFEPMSSVIARLFPLENGLESLPSCEDSFNMLVSQLAAPKIATH
jgi:WD40 repeat protein